MLSRIATIVLGAVAAGTLAALLWSMWQAAALQSDLDAVTDALVQEKRATEALEASVAELEKAARLAQQAEARMREASREMDARSRAAALAMEEWRRTHEDDLVERVPAPLLDLADLLRCRNAPGAQGCDGDENGAAGDPGKAD